MRNITRLKHPERREYFKRYYRENREKKKKWFKEFYQKNKTYYKKYSKIRNAKIYKKLRGEVFKDLGAKCNHCGFNDIRALQIDHINDDGYKDRKKGIVGYELLSKILNNIDNYQILCANCNWIKRYKHKYKHI